MNLFITWHQVVVHQRDMHIILVQNLMYSIAKFLFCDLVKKREKKKSTIPQFQRAKEQRDLTEM